MTSRSNKTKKQVSDVDPSYRVACPVFFTGAVPSPEPSEYRSYSICWHALGIMEHEKSTQCDV
jgi:hypothetical protein